MEDIVQVCLRCRESVTSRSTSHLSVYEAHVALRAEASAAPSGDPEPSTAVGAKRVRGGVEAQQATRQLAFLAECGRPRASASPPALTSLGKQLRLRWVVQHDPVSGALVVWSHSENLVTRCARSLLDGCLAAA